MDDPAVLAKQLVDLARKHIEDQQSRIVRQRELMAKYERDDDTARLSEARLVLERVQKHLAPMTAAPVSYEEHLSKLTVDEASVEKVVRDRFSHCPLHIEVKNGFRATRAVLRQTTPAGTAHSLRAIADKIVADEIDVDVPVGRPMPLEIVKKVGPIRFQAVRLEISNWKREGVVDTDRGGAIFGKPFDQPFGDAKTGPVFARARWWNHLDGRRYSIRCTDSQAF